MYSTLEKIFQLKENDTNVRREVIGGITTFCTMSYIVFVQPAILSIAGMDYGSVVLATCISSAIACFLMAFFANYPIALAPGMGENFLFTFTLCLGMGFSWQSSLAIVFIAGVLFVLLSLFKTREKIIEIFPDCLKNAIPAAIGMLITFVGLQWAGLIVLNPGTMVSVGSLTKTVPLITIISLLLILFLQSIKFTGAILVGIFFSSIAYLVLGVIPWTKPELTYSFSTFFKLDFYPLLEKWKEAIPAIFIFFFLDLFDTVGTLVGVGNAAGLMKEGKLPRAGGAFLADAISTCIGAVCGTSTVTSYVESAAGVASGARTGFAALIAGICFILTIPLVPFLSVLGYDVGPQYYEQMGMQGTHISMYPSASPALIIIGFFMMGSVRRILWDDISEGLPAFLTIVFMAFGYGITEGISIGCVSYVIVKCIFRKYRDVNVWMYLVAFAFIVRYIFFK